MVTFVTNFVQIIANLSDKQYGPVGIKTRRLENE